MSTLVKPTAPRTLTYEQYMEEWLTEPPTRRPYQIIDGVRIYMPSPIPWHQELVYRVSQTLRRYQEESHRGHMFMAPLDVLIRRDPLRTRQPDVMFISQERLDATGGIRVRGPIATAPELVVEVLSPSESRPSLNAKIRDFCRLGSNECWVVNADDESIEVLRLMPSGAERVAVYHAGETLNSVVFPGLTVSVVEVFAE